MPIRIEEQQPERKQRRWVWLLSAVLAVAGIACAAFLPMVWPNAFVGEWERPIRGVPVRLTYRPDGIVANQFTGGAASPFGWQHAGGAAIQCYSIDNGRKRFTYLEQWRIHPFGLSATVMRKSQVRGGESITLHRVIHPITDWFPFLSW